MPVLGTNDILGDGEGVCMWYIGAPPCGVGGGGGDMAALDELAKGVCGGSECECECDTPTAPDPGPVDGDGSGEIGDCERSDKDAEATEPDADADGCTLILGVGNCAGVAEPLCDDVEGGGGGTPGPAGCERVLLRGDGRG